MWAAQEIFKLISHIKLRIGRSPHHDTIPFLWNNNKKRSNSLADDDDDDDYRDAGVVIVIVMMFDATVGGLVLSGCLREIGKFNILKSYVTD